MKFVYFIFAVVTLGIGSILVPPIRDVSTAIFDSFGGTETMPPFLALLVQLWPVWLLAAFVVGAIAIVRTRSQ